MVYAVLIVESDQNLRESFTDILLNNGFSVTAISTRSDAISAIEKKQPDLVIFDLDGSLPEGERIFQDIKKRYPILPMIVLVGSANEVIVVNNLNLGDHEYMINSVEKRALLDRVKSTLAKTDDKNAPTITVDDLCINLKSNVVTRDGKKVDLSVQEYKLLEYLMQNKGKVVTREMVLSKIWLYSRKIETRVVDVYIGYLRRKLESGGQKKLIYSIRGIGYCLKQK